METIFDLSGVFHFVVYFFNTLYMSRQHFLLLFSLQFYEMIWKNKMFKFNFASYIFDFFCSLQLYFSLLTNKPKKYWRKRRKSLSNRVFFLLPICLDTFSMCLLTYNKLLNVHCCCDRCSYWMRGSFIYHF